MADPDAVLEERAAQLRMLVDELAALPPQITDAGPTGDDPVSCQVGTADDGSRQ